MSMFVGISKNLVVCGYAFYQLKNREQKIVSDFPVLPTCRGLLATMCEKYSESVSLN